MTTPAAQYPEVCEFPGLRPAGDKDHPQKGPSIDAILRRTNPSNASLSQLVSLGVEDCFESLEAGEADLRERQREFAALRAETMERLRVVKETELLLATREGILDDREAILAARLASSRPDQGMATLEHSLREARQALGRANQTIARMDESMASLRAEMEALMAARDAAAPEPAESHPTGFESITHKSLAEQVAFLREREAFIQKSENILFDKAQHLQEWETRLQQSEHDRACGM